MNEHNGIKTVFFDYDGCIHDSLRIYAPAFRQAQNFLSLAGYGSSESRTENYSDEFIRKWIGLSPKQMWLDFRPDLSIDIREQASEIIGSHMYNSIVIGNAVLYSGAIEIGDRASDISAGKANKMKTIGCNYGYAVGGELESADYRIDTIAEIIEILKIKD